MPESDITHPTASLPGLSWLKSSATVLATACAIGIGSGDARAQYSMSGSFSDLIEVSRNSPLISRWPDSDASRYQYVYVAPTVDPVAYASYYRAPNVPTVKSSGNYPIGSETLQSTPYRYFTATFKTPGLYSLTVTSADDPISAIYVIKGSNKGLPYDGANPRKNLYAFSDDSGGRQRTAPWTIYYNQEDTRCTLVEFLIYEFDGGGEALTGSFQASGPGKIATNCNISTQATTQAMLRNMRALTAVLDQRKQTSASSIGYDCGMFNGMGMCASLQSRYAADSVSEEFAGVFTAAARLTQHVRLGLFIDQRLATKDPAGLQLRNETPMFGAFVGINERTDRTGWYGKLAASYAQSNVRIARPIIDDSEPGSGDSRLRTFSVSGEVGYGLRVQDVVAVPYIGLGIASASRSAYAEGSSDIVTSPISYDEYHRRQTTVSAGVRVYGNITESVGFEIGGGIAKDVDVDNNVYSGRTEIADLATFAHADPNHYNTLRAMGLLRLDYKLAETQHLTLAVSGSQNMGSEGAGLTVMSGYRIGF